MGVVTRGFVADSEELRRHFVGWKEPLPKPVRRQVPHPVTGEPIVIQTTAPDPNEPFPAEANQPVNLRSLGAKELPGLLPAEMEDLMRLALRADRLQANEVNTVALHGPSSERLLLKVPARLVTHLAGLSEQAVASLGDSWSSTVGAEFRRHLALLAELSRRAVAERKLVVLWITVRNA
jgi:hypothetical protein